MESELSFGRELCSWREAEMLFQQVRNVMNHQYDIELPTPDLVHTPHRDSSFMCAIPSHSPTEDLSWHGDIVQFYKGSHRFVEVGDNPVVLYIDPQRAEGTRNTFEYAYSFAHELGHCALFAHKELTSYTESNDPILALHEGISKVFSRDLLKHLLADDNARKYGITNLDKIMIGIWIRIRQLCSFGMDTSSRFNNNSYKTVVAIMEKLGLRMAEVLENPSLVFDQIPKNNHE